MGAVLTAAAVVATAMAREAGEAASLVVTMVQVNKGE